ncbi:MAG: hypothetical protein FVQ83_08285 [Chloroflexi bacterium]|nr:hypothetical protein [Chloroflexota bacterium]
MSNITQVIGQRRKRREKQSKTASKRFGRLGVILLTVLGVLAAVVVVPVALAYADLTQGLPSLDSLPLMLEPPTGYMLHPTRLYDRSGEQVILTLEHPAASEKNYLFLYSLPQSLIDATLAAADPTFWDHPGFVWQDLNASGAGTLAERLVSDLLLWDEPPSTTRDWRVRILAAQATARFGREKILEWYLNTADYGQLAFGADAAARVYFGKNGTSLTLAESALLAAVSQAPDLNPIDAPQLALQRQQQVLENMLAFGSITADQAVQANAIPLEIRGSPPILEDPFPNFTGLVIEQLSAHFGEARLKRGGLKIITTLDLDVQTQASCAAAAQISRLVDNDEEANILDDEECHASRLLPALRREAASASEGLSASVVVLDPIEGQVLALVGSFDAQHTPGSLLSPFVYLTAFTRGFSPASLVWDIPASLPSNLAGFTNPDGEFHGPVRIRTALANDYIIPAVQILNQIGAENVWLTARQSGLQSLETPSGEAAQRLLLDSGGVTLLDAAYALGMFANQGLLAGQALSVPVTDSVPAPLSPAAVLKVMDYGGQVFLDWERPEIRAITSAQLAYLVNHILSDEIARRPSLGHPNPLEIGRPVAAKIGQTTSGQDVWTVGYTPQQVVGVWVGYQDEAETGQISPMVAAGLWNAILKYTHSEIPVSAWDEPAGIVSLDVCDPSGMLPTVECPLVVREVFTSENVPLQLDNLYRSFQINSQTSRLATVFTPSENIEEEVFLVLPPEAVEWARETGFATPPETYDVLIEISTENEDVNILTPEMFAYVRSELDIIGTAAGDEFDFFSIQVGEGLNPRQWQQIGEDGITPVENGLLASWDTAGLNGLYAIRLLVVRQDQSIETAIIQITVDNQIPELEILYPSAGQSFSYPEETSLTFQAQAVDNLGIERVEFYIDDEIIITLRQAPFAAPWFARLGNHELRVVAFDFAGNQIETALEFIVE